MKLRSKRLLKLNIFSSLFIISSLSFGSTQTETFIGRAYDLKNPEKLIYTETHELTSTQDEIPLNSTVIYQLPSGETLAEKTLDFKIRPTQPIFETNQKVTGSLEGVRVPNDLTNTPEITSLEVYYRENQDKKIKSKPFSLKSNTVIDGGFHYSVREHWETLLAGNVVEIGFLSPTRQKTFNFNIRKLPILADDKVSSNDIVQFSFEAKNGFLRWLVKPILLTYDVNTKRLLIFEGITNLSDENGDSFHARIEYDYN